MSDTIDRIENAVEDMSSVIAPERARWTLPAGQIALVVAPDGHLLVVHAETVARWLETTKATLDAMSERDAEIVRLNACVSEHGRLALCGVIGQLLGEEVGDMTASGGNDAKDLTESIVSGFRERDEKISQLAAEETRSATLIVLRDGQLARLEVAARKVVGLGWEHGENCPHRDCDTGGCCNDGTVSENDGCEATGQACDCHVASCYALSALLSPVVRS